VIAAPLGGIEQPPGCLTGLVLESSAGLIHPELEFRRRIVHEEPRQEIAPIQLERRPADRPANASASNAAASHQSRFDVTPTSSSPRVDYRPPPQQPPQPAHRLSERAARVRVVELGPEQGDEGIPATGTEVN
jgi:hypothetical protein